jgi:oligopeptide/dipeptide ABC transporter ATP-binding protein
MNGKENIPILRLRGLNKSFSTGIFRKKSIRVIDNVDLDVNAGEIHGIVGESGAGKTTLARCSLRLLEPSSGSIQFNGEELTRLDAGALRARRREFQMVFQDSAVSLNPAMTVEQILMEPLQIHKLGDRDFRLSRIRESMEAVSLSASLMQRRPAELSGGQRQRVGIARGLILKPKLVIADEPVSALDASVQAQTLNLLADLRRQYGHTLILISHSLSALHYLCTHISVLYKGSLVEEAPASVFFDKPRHPYSKTLLEATRVLAPGKGAGSEAPSVATSFALPPESGCAFHPYCADKLSICTRQTPRLNEIAERERVACFLYSQHSP